MSSILYILLALVVLGIIIICHEFGHYIVGRLCGFGITEFAVGFGPKLVSWERKGICYSLRAIPMGGFCAFVGEDEANDDSRAFNNQKLWKRFLTVLAGPMMNFVLAFVLCVIMLLCYYTTGIGVEHPAVLSVDSNSPAYQAGLMAEDIVLAVNGQDIPQEEGGVQAIIDQIRDGNDQTPVVLKLQRADEIIEISVVPQLVDRDGQQVRQIGVILGTQYDATRRLTLGEAITTTPSYTVRIMQTMLESLRDLIFQGKGADEVTGTVGMVAVTSRQIEASVRAHRGLVDIMWLMYIITLNLGIINLLPLPALDGGRLVFMIIEAIRGKPVPPEKEGMVHFAGFILIIGLFILLTYKDISNIVTGGFDKYFE